MQRELLNLFKKAEEAAMAAGKGITPEPMVVVERLNPFDDNSAIVKQYEPIADGLCGFAYINFVPGNSKIANAAKKRYGYRKPNDWNSEPMTAKERAFANTVGIGEVFKRYYGGVQASVWAFNQSHARKSAFARAYCQVFADAGFGEFVSYESRLD
jgi:hypothetical protein